SDEGLVWRSDVPLARQIGASVDSMDLSAFTAEAHRRGIYVIGRFTVFKDPRLAIHRPDLAITTPQGKPWEDAPGVAYADPFEPRVWQYMGDLATEMATHGVDEIQYDYVRFPVDGDLSTARYRRESTTETRPPQITAFVRYMEQRLRPMKVFISADIFGRVVWHPVDAYTGQILEDFVPYVDYVSPMLYPSGFNAGSGGYDVPTQHSYGLMKQSLLLTKQRLESAAALSRPWLQSFDDYAFHQPYGLQQYLEQRRAAEEVGTSGWLYWNAAGVYDERTFAERP
ncbi:MAG: putative glycoside hydrolase, partial [Chloroflexota bacterium]|nr:putative glycoside hydrolase [Chloroflexota bacterium]